MKKFRKATKAPRINMKYITESSFTLRPCFSIIPIFFHKIS